MDFPSFVGADYQSAAKAADQERLVNMYVERLEAPGASSKAALYVVPGVTSIATALTSPGRAHFEQADREFAVIGTAFVEIDEPGNITVRGTVATGNDPATICSNGDGGGQLLITSGSNAYSYNLTTDTLTQIAALNGKATSGDYLDGYGLVLDATSSTFYISALLDFSTWATGTDFAQRSKASDPWRSLKVSGIYIALLGEQTSEFWYDAGGASFPFAPHPSGLIPYGVAAGFSPAVGEGNLFWLGKSSIGQRYVLQATGFTPQIISDFPRQLEFEGYEMVSDAEGEVINWRGHTFYRITFPHQNISWAYDLSTGLWFQWGTWIAEENDYVAARTRWHVIAFGEHRTLDAESASVYRFDADSHEDVEERPIRWLRRSPALSAENELIFYQWFELAFEPGVGSVTGQGADPRVMARFSRDGGATWGNERWRSLGKQGEYMRRARWEQLGAARALVVEVTGTDPVPMAIVGAALGLAQPIRALQGKGAAA